MHPAPQLRDWGERNPRNGLELPASHAALRSLSGKVTGTAGRRQAPSAEQWPRGAARHTARCFMSSHPANPCPKWADAAGPSPQSWAPAGRVQWPWENNARCCLASIMH